MKRFYTAESVTEGHPDKLCDLTADSVLDDCLKEDFDSRVACEVLATKGRIIVAGENTGRHNPNVSDHPHTRRLRSKKVKLEFFIILRRYDYQKNS